MKVELVQDGQAVTVLAVHMRGVVPLLVQLQALPPNLEKSKNELLGLISAIADGAVCVRDLSHDVCHEVNDKPKIFQLTKGRLRLLWFYGSHKPGRELMVCVNVFIKSTNRTPESEKGEAVKGQKRYKAASQANEIMESVEHAVIVSKLFHSKFKDC